MTFYIESHVKEHNLDANAIILRSELGVDMQQHSDFDGFVMVRCLEAVINGFQFIGIRPVEANFITGQNLGDRQGEEFRCLCKNINNGNL